jgi:hypothetical protein
LGIEYQGLGQAKNKRDGRKDNTGGSKVDGFLILFSPIIFAPPYTDTYTLKL